MPSQPAQSEREETNSPQNRVAFPMDPGGISRYVRHSPMYVTHYNVLVCSYAIGRSRNMKITSIRPLTTTFPQ